MGIEEIQKSIDYLLDPPRQHGPTKFPINGLPKSTRDMIGQEFGHEYNPD